MSIIAVGGNRPPQLIGSPIDLGTAPAVNRCLLAAGFGELSPEGLRSPGGRNAAWIGVTTTGRQVFVKHLMTSSDRDDRLRRVIAFEEFSDQVFQDDTRPGPRLLAHDADTGVLVFDVVPGEGGAQLVVDEEFTEEHFRQVGELLGTLHGAPVADPSVLDSSPLLYPDPAHLHALPARWFESLSFGEIQAWQLMQQDPALLEGIDRLVTAERRAPRAPAHCDFRLDQLLFGDRPMLVDWEEFRLADAARDVGAFVGEWLYRSVLDIITTRGGQEPIGPDPSHDVVLGRGVANLNRTAPLIASFWHAYRTQRPALDSEFITRTVGFAGWHTLDRLLAGGTRRARLSGIERAAAGIGRTALVDPARFHQALGLDVR